MSTIGSFPFGEPLRPLAQVDRSRKRAFVLGVYASAVHARWFDRQGRLLVRALAVASEPTIFWDGMGAADAVAAVDVPDGAGHLEAAEGKFNGPSGRSIDEDFLRPLGLTRSEAWLCDLVPHACMNPQQKAAIDRAYEPRREALKLPAVRLPGVPKSFADDRRRAEVLAEIREANPDVIVLLGDQPIRHWLRAFDSRSRRLADFGENQSSYGRLHDVLIDGRRFRVLPLAHPRQVGALGRHSEKWRLLHARWKATEAPRLL